MLPEPFLYFSLNTQCIVRSINERNFYSHIYTCHSDKTNLTISGYKAKLILAKGDKTVSN
jgi:hypothetical protein